MSVLRDIWDDLKGRKLLPVAVVLLVAIVAVPIVLSGSSSAPPPTTTANAPGGTAAGLPAVSQTAAPNAAPGGKARDPFAGASGAAPAQVSTTTTSTTAPVTGGSTGSTGGATSTTPGSTTTPPSNPGSSTPGGSSPPSSSPGGGSGSSPTIPTPKPKHTTPTLSAEQSYAVSLAITNARGGIDTLSPLARLSPLPSASEPLVVELGVLRGGSRVLFAVQPGTMLSGPGTCVPGPIDCEILSLAQEQTEKLSLRTVGGPTESALFAVTAISTVHHPSHSAAMKARDDESAAGRHLLAHSSLTALSLFRYEPGEGAVQDLRNLTLRDS